MGFDVNKYRSSNDTEKEWQLKKLFIERHHGKFSEDRLLCLSQCYVNIETMGCRYSNEIMKQINQLTEDFKPIIQERLDEFNKQNAERSNKRQPQQSQSSASANNNNNSRNNNNNKKNDSSSSSTNYNKTPNKQNNLADNNKKSTSTSSNSNTPKVQQQQQQQQQNNNNNNNAKQQQIKILSRDFNKLNTNESSSSPSTSNSTSLLAHNDNKVSPTNKSLVANNNNNASFNNSIDLASLFKPASTAHVNFSFNNNNNNYVNSVNSPIQIKPNKSFNSSKSLLNANLSSNSLSTPSVPNTTTELAPAPSLVPIPFELAQIKFDLGDSFMDTSNTSNNNNNKKTPKQTSTMPIRSNNNNSNNNNNRSSNQLQQDQQQQQQQSPAFASSMTGKYQHQEKHVTIELLSSSLPLPANQLSTKQSTATETNKSVDVVNKLFSSFNSGNLQPIANAPTNANLIIGNDNGQFVKLNKINKLREFLRKDFPKQAFYKATTAHGNKNNNNNSNSNQNESNSTENNLINYLMDSCNKNGIELNYVQYVNSEENMYFGELFLESLRIMNGWDRKRKRCCFFAHKKALNLLVSDSELAVKQIQSEDESPMKKNKKFKMENSPNKQQQQQTGANSNNFEIYQVDIASTQPQQQVNKKKITATKVEPAPKAATKSESEIKTPATKSEANDLTAMLKSILIKDKSSASSSSQQQQQQLLNDQSIIATSTPSSSSAIIKPNTATTVPIAQINPDKENEIASSSALDNSNESTKEGVDEASADDDEENTKNESDKRTKIKTALGQEFVLLIPSDSSSESSTTNSTSTTTTASEGSIFHEKNAIAILTHSTTKNKCKLEFEMQVKADNTKTKSVLSGDRLQSESDDELNASSTTPAQQSISGSKRKYKCKILINGVRIAANHAKTKVDAKRKASLKACKYLAKIYPMIRETNHTYSSSSSSSTINNNNMMQRAAISNNENSQPSQLPQQQQQQQQQQPVSGSESYRYHKISKEALFSATTTLLPPTSFESSSSFPLNVLNNNIMTSLFASSSIATQPASLQFGSN